MPTPDDPPGLPALLAGVRVVELCGEAGRVAGAVLAALGAAVRATGPPPGPATSWRSDHHRVLDRHKRVLDPDPAAVDAALAAADLVLTDWRTPDAVLARVPGASIHVRITPYGAEGPRSGWRGSDLTITAASGNLHATGDPDRPPVACSEPASYAHAGGEAAVAALTALAAGRPQRVDVSVQETVQSANMTGAARYPQTGDRGQRRGARIGPTRETWPCADGWVVFGLRGGAARARNWKILRERMEDEGLDAGALADRDFTSFDPRAATPELLEELETAVGAWFARHTMRELYDAAVETGLMVAPVADAGVIRSDPQLAARDLLEDGIPSRFVRGATVGAPPADPGPGGAGRGHDARTGADAGARAWAGLTVLELGSGAAGPLITRYFAEHGATVVRIESRRRPDFLRRRYGDRDDLPELEGSTMFAVLNAGKRSVTLDLKTDRGHERATRLAVEADAVVENFAPGVMERLGLDYAALAATRGDLVMLSSSLYGGSGPHRRYPGFGSQGAALSGYTHLTGWPERAPVGPYGTITDSLAPRYGAAALAAALHWRRRTGRGIHLDLSQVEAAVWTLSPWLARCAETGEDPGRTGTAHPAAIVHGVFPTRGDDRHVAVVAWDQQDWARLAGIAGVPTSLSPQEAAERLGRWTAARTADAVAERLQAAGVEAYPVNDFADLHRDPQLATRGHFVEIEHPLLGPHLCERSGFRLPHTPGGVPGPGPTLGQHTAEVLGQIGCRP